MAVREACRHPALLWRCLLDSGRLLWLRAWAEAAPAHARTAGHHGTGTTDEPGGTERTDGTELTGGTEADGVVPPSTEARTTASDGVCCPPPPGWLLRLPLPRTAACITESCGSPGAELLLDILAR